MDTECDDVANPAELRFCVTDSDCCQRRDGDVFPVKAEGFCSRHVVDEKSRFTSVGSPPCGADNLWNGLGLSARGKSRELFRPAFYEGLRYHVALLEKLGVAPSCFIKIADQCDDIPLIRSRFRPVTSRGAPVDFAAVPQDDGHHGTTAEAPRNAEAKAVIVRMVGNDATVAEEVVEMAMEDILIGGDWRSAVAFT